MASDTRRAPKSTVRRTRETRRIGWHRGEGGQTTAEHAGVVLLMAAVVSLVALAGGDIAQAISRSVESAFCRILGVGCGGAEAGHRIGPYPVEIDERGVKVGGSVAIVHVGKDVTYVKEHSSDGTWKVTVKEGTEGGVTGQVGAHGKVKTGQGEHGGGLSADGGVDLRVGNSETYSFPSSAAADEFISRSARQAAADAAGPVGQGAYGLWKWATGDDYDPPAPDESSVEGGLALSGSLGAGAGASGSLAAGLSEALGRKVDHKTGETTYYLDYGASLSGDAGVVLSGGLGGGGDGDVRMGLTLDRDGRPTKLSLDATGTYTGGLDIAGEWKSMSDVARGVKEARVEGKDQSGSTLVFSAELDLTRPENRAAAEAFVRSLAPGGRSPGDAAAALIRRFDEDGEMLLLRYDTSTSEWGVSAGAGFGPKVSADAEYSSERQVLTCATSHVPGKGFEVVQGCGP